MHTRSWALALGYCAGLAGCSQAVEAAAPLPTPVKVQTVAAFSGNTETRYSGTLEPAVRVDLAFRVGGYIEALGEAGQPRHALSKGDRVNTGSLLARLRRTEYTQKRSTAQAQTSEARASLRLSQDDLERAKRLFESGAITQAELDVKSARGESAEAQLAAAQARLDEAELAVSDTELKAPREAAVLTRHVEVGSLVAAGQPVFTLVDTRTLKVVFGAPQTLVEKLRIGSPLRVHASTDSKNDGQPLVHEARVSRIAPAADGAGRVFSVEAELKNSDGALHAGSVVSVVVPDAPANTLPSVPLSAVVRSASDPRGFAVFVLPNDAPRAAVELRDVQLGELLGNSVSVTAGLQDGERVVSMGASLLRDGSDAVLVQ